MWAGFMGRFYVDHLPKQRFLDMKNIPEPPTNKYVIVQTLKVTQACTAELGQRYGVLTYDLDVAMNALKIQSTESPTFDDVFILFGVFHISICLFRAIGKLISESGGPQLLVDADVLASGSVRGFIECTNYNHCKRLHPMFALALRVLHFREFLTTYENFDELVTLIRGYDQRPVNGHHG